MILKRSLKESVKSISKQTAKEIAVGMIRPYVLRGDSIESLRAGQQGQAINGDWCSIGGWVNNKHYDTKHIIVSKINNKEVEEIFKLEELYNEIKSPQLQML